MLWSLVMLVLTEGFRAAGTSSLLSQAGIYRFWSCSALVSR